MIHINTMPQFSLDHLRLDCNCDHWKLWIWVCLTLAEFEAAAHCTQQFMKAK